jgi:hypothetical protein
MEALDYHVLINKFTTLAEFDGSVVESPEHALIAPTWYSSKHEAQATRRVPDRSTTATVGKGIGKRNSWPSFL